MSILLYVHFKKDVSSYPVFCNFLHSVSRTDCKDTTCLLNSTHSTFVWTPQRPVWLHPAFYLSLTVKQEHQQVWSESKPQKNLRLFNRREKRKSVFFATVAAVQSVCSSPAGCESSANIKFHPWDCCWKAQLADWLFSHTCQLLIQALSHCWIASFQNGYIFPSFLLAILALCWLCATVPYPCIYILFFVRRLRQNMTP